MIAAPIPHDDAHRLQALRELLILDTPPEERFDRVVRFAAEEFDMPIALMNLVDADRLWLKARVGLDICETSRETSFCSHAIVRPGLFMVEDTLEDVRFADNPFVVDPPHIRFYAGAPLQLPTGEIVGTLCLIDHRPRTLDDLDQAILGSLRDLMLEELIARRAVATPAAPIITG